jgi:GNAT superfamily N-acetyltransferase
MFGIRICLYHGPEEMMVQYTLIAMELFTTDIGKILPTQLYISEEKYKRSRTLFTKNGYGDYPPIPIKCIGNDVFFTDGHTRALILWEHGIQEISVYEDTDDMDWIMYLLDLAWCDDAGIRAIENLKDRKVDGETYQREWIERCGASHRLIQENPLRDLEIRFEEDPRIKSSICREVLDSLTGWFGIVSAVQDYIHNVRHLPFVIARLYGKVVGFCALKVNDGINVDLYVLGIFEEFHRRGIGTKLIQFIDQYCCKSGISYMSVKTLSERSENNNYAKTRKFYASCGFRPFGDIPVSWNVENPCLYMIKKVNDPPKDALPLDS